MSRLHRPKAGSWIRACVAVMYPTGGLLFRLRWRHLDRVPPPEAGGVIIAVNHLSHIDTVLMARLIWQAGRIPRFLVKAGLFGVPGLGQVARGARQIPVHRGTSDAAKSLDEALQALRRGEAVVIYPEGTITHDPQQWPMQGRTGIARLWLMSPDTPVVPIGQWGAQHETGAFAPKRLLRHGRPESLASVGDPVDLTRFHDCEPTAEALRDITDAIMGAIRDEVAQLRGEPAPTEFFAPTHKRVDKV